ncbi:MAG: hypothetical protein QMD97_01645 [Candidatus Aenigmarchaeota archaeon]|nr:hypothetical protein [Candidatus Aenigmarchaeota archaeon]
MKQKCAELIMCDTSSAIEASYLLNGRALLGKSLPVALYATSGIMEELRGKNNGVHNGKRGCVRGFVREDIYNSFEPLPAIDNPVLDGIRYAVWLGSHDAGVVGEKKTAIDVVSRNDIELASRAIYEAARGVPVMLLSEDSHITDTCRALLQKEYSQAIDTIKIADARSFLGLLAKTSGNGSG